MATPGGRRRREAAHIGKRCIQAKIVVEEQYMEHLTNRSARLNRRAVQVLSLFESSLLDMAAEAMAHGFDPGVVVSDFIFSSPGTDVIDVGSDLVNSEVMNTLMNTLLNTADVTDTGVAGRGRAAPRERRPGRGGSGSQDVDRAVVRAFDEDGRRAVHMAHDKRPAPAAAPRDPRVAESPEGGRDAPASHHAWQVNYLFEAAMFGSILDGGALAGKLDMAERK
ncbi:hypothetical protein ISF_08503 [Cordyceps fumosorosea ARSEF 2679]|uniref:Uncharacterized protein n=1 Tax=Cordyceps fumosorosea (strain ARSEF 2679) TaxID=1081104 RepID=A0A167M747_CORFA|nr:hypothetical protein ISF_08503 [Cordyceps fumosorosea ARSEF 2679]OAA54023.1 hypothetical protein ISF_08503 [Cordyceps fumosorosea ARSEF 2679]